MGVCKAKDLLDDLEIPKRSDAEILAILGVILRKINRIEAEVTSLTQAHVISFYVNIEGIKTKVDHMFLKITQALPVAVAFQDKLGNAAKVDGLPVWAVTDESLAKLEVAEDGMSVVVKPTGLVGAFKLQCKADADLGEGVKEILGELDIELLSGEAELVVLAAGEPTDM